MEKEPTNLQAQSLANLIEKKVTHGTFKATPVPLAKLIILPDGYIGMAIVGGVMAVSAILAGSLIRRAFRK